MSWLQLLLTAILRTIVIETRRIHSVSSQSDCSISAVTEDAEATQTELNDRAMAWPAVSRQERGGKVSRKETLKGGQGGGQSHVLALNQPPFLLTLPKITPKMLCM